MKTRLLMALTGVIYISAPMLAQTVLAQTMLAQTVLAQTVLAQTVLAQTVLAQTTPLPSFSAETVQIAPDQSERVGSITKSGPFMRLEFAQDGQQIIQILRPTEGIVLVLYPAERRYIERRGPIQPAQTADSYTPPCPATAEQNGLTCRRLGQERYQSIPVERWRVGSENSPTQMVILWDPMRKRALRQEMQNGALLQMTFLEMQTIDRREAEHWITEISRSGAATQRSEWWYDPALKLILRETLPDGTRRRLQNIVVGPVDPSRFTVPDGWQRIDTPDQAIQE